MYQNQNIANYQELVTIYNNLANNVFVDQNQMMKAMIGSMINLMNQNGEIVQLKQEVSNLTNTVKDLEEELGTAKVKVSNLEYEFVDVKTKTYAFSTDDTIIIRNLEVPEDGDEEKVVKEVLSHISVKDFDPEEVVIRVERKGKRNDKLGTVFVKISNQGLKSEIMKKKKELADKPDDKLKRLKIMNFKNQEQILFENAPRQVLSIMPNGHQYELNGSMKLVTKK